MVFALQPDEPLAGGIRRVAAEEVDAAVALLSGDGAHPPDEAVHAARKSLKKVRAVLRLVRPHLGPAYGAESACYRDAGRALSAARDAAVLLAVYTALVDELGDDLPLDVVIRIRRVLEGDLSAARGQTGTDAVDGVVAALSQARQRIDHWPLPDGGPELLRPGLARTHRHARRALAAATASRHQDDLHEWRKRVKDGWYHLRLLCGAWPAVLEPVAEEAHRLADLLGDDHDLAVLISSVTERVDAVGPAAELTPLLALAERRRRRLHDDALALGRRLYAEPPRARARRLLRYWAAAADEAAQARTGDAAPRGDAGRPDTLGPS